MQEEEKEKRHRILPRSVAQETKGDGTDIAAEGRLLVVVDNPDESKVIMGIPGVR